MFLGQPLMQFEAAIAALDDRAQRLVLQRVEGFRVAKKIGHPDQHVAQQGLGLLGLALQQSAIGRQVAQAVHLQSPLEAAQHGGALVVAEVMAGARAQAWRDRAPASLAAHERDRLLP